MKNCKIALTGAGGVGKGTLIKEFRKLRPDFVAITSPMRPVAAIISTEASNYEDYDEQGKRLLQYSCLCAEMNAERVLSENGSSFVAERSVIDFLPYYEQAFDDSRTYADCIHRYLEENPYDILAYIPEEFAPTEADLKENTWKERNSRKRAMTNARLKEILESVRKDFPSISVITVTGTPTERASILCKAVEHHESNP